MLDAKITCTFCGATFNVSAPDPQTLRDEVDGGGCWHTCCSVCKSAIVWHEDRWWHLAGPVSSAPKDIDPRAVDLDEDHQAVPAQSDGPVTSKAPAQRGQQVPGGNHDTVRVRGGRDASGEQLPGGNLAGQADHSDGRDDSWRDWTWFRCPECGAEWGSQQEEPDREWCGCNSAEFPVRIAAQVDGQERRPG